MLFYNTNVIVAEPAAWTLQKLVEHRQSFQHEFLGVFLYFFLVVRLYEMSAEVLPPHVACTIVGAHQAHRLHFMIQEVMLEIPRSLAQARWVTLSAYEWVIGIHRAFVQVHRPL